MKVYHCISLSGQRRLIDPGETKCLGFTVSNKCEGTNLETCGYKQTIIKCEHTVMMWSFQVWLFSLFNSFSPR